IPLYRHDLCYIPATTSYFTKEQQMTASMTAFCRIQADLAEGSLIWEIRSVNHRYLDVHLKLPDELKVLETGCRELLNNRLNRGRIDAVLKLESNQKSNPDLTVNTEVLSALGGAIDQVSKHLGQIGVVSPCEVLRWPGVLQESASDIESLGRISLDALGNAVSELIESRHREGSRMQQLIGDRISSARKIVTDLRTSLPDIELGMKQRWQRRLEELGEDVDPSRMAQELALLLTRNDVSEELDRLDTHFDEVSRVLASNKPAGRRLDFLMQELNREANTLGSKSVDMRNTNASVELKVLIDQMREQVQNIE
ncbi:MAG: YicC/YloC family endoribonuclease, partial [bacterium]